MLRRRELIIGKSYVNEERQLMREVVDVDRKVVSYRTYELGTGDLFGDIHKCTRNQFVRWADREATHEEMANQERHEVNALYETDNYTFEKEPDLFIEQTQLMALNRLINR